jgi:hypothetical protein
MPSNYALQRSVTALSERAAGAGTIFAPAALGSGFPRPAQRGRWAAAIMLCKGLSHSLN